MNPRPSPPRQAKTTRTLTQDQRLGWIKELLTSDAESLPYRVAGTLLLLYAQPLVLTTTAIVVTAHEAMDFPWHRTSPSARTLRRHAHSPPTQPAQSAHRRRHDRHTHRGSSPAIAQASTLMPKPS